MPYTKFIKKNIFKSFIKYWFLFIFDFEIFILRRLTTPLFIPPSQIFIKTNSKLCYKCPENSIRTGIVVLELKNFIIKLTRWLTNLFYSYKYRQTY